MRKVTARILLLAGNRRCGLNVGKVLSSTREQRKSFQKHAVDQPENPVDGAEGPILSIAPEGMF